jgi:hypothetical protein
MDATTTQLIPKGGILHAVAQASHIALVHHLKLV